MLGRVWRRTCDSLATLLSSCALSVWRPLMVSLCCSALHEGR